MVYGHFPYEGQAFKWNYIYRNNDGLYVQLGNAIVTGGEYPWNVSYNNGVVVTKEAAARLISTLSGSASEGSSIYAARADHIHIFPTASEVGAYSINNPSGFITGIENLVYTTGDQNISGVKNFIQRPTVNGTGILLEGEVQNNTIISGVLYSAQVNIKNNHTGTLYKGQPVYINGATGGNILVGLASNTGEATSSKTLGLIYQDSLAVNAFGTVITDGLLPHFDVGSAAAGDPIWLGPTGNLIYGLANKPVAPNHLVYLGVVTRTNNNGEVFVKVQNGYELDELHDVNVKNSPTGQFLFKNANSQWVGKNLDSSDANALGLTSSSYIIAKPGDDLAAKYTAAKALTPNGSAKSATNRASLIIFPGNYTLSAELAIDEEFVDLIGLGAQTQKPAVLIGGNTLNVYADDVHVSGISVGSQPFKIGSDISKPSQVFENCSGGDNSFGYSHSNDVFAGGTFVNCIAGRGSFGFSANYYGRATGRFTNCIGGPNCFGGEWGEASGTFVNCIGDGGSFGSYPQEGSTIGTVSGTLTNCRLIYGTFQVLSAPATGKATMINCIDGNGDIIEGEA